MLPTQDYTNIFRPLLVKFGFFYYMFLFCFLLLELPVSSFSSCIEMIASYLYNDLKHRYVSNFRLRHFHFPIIKSIISLHSCVTRYLWKKCNFVAHQPHCLEERSSWIENHFYLMSSLLKLELRDEWFSLLGEVWSVAILVPLKYWAMWLYIADCFGIKRDLFKWSLYSKDLKTVVVLRALRKHSSKLLPCR